MSRSTIPEEQKEAMSMQITTLLRYGKENARTRHELCEATGFNDRLVRELIEKARLDGWLVCNDQDGRGYYLGWTQEEIERQYRRQKSRMVSVWNAMLPFYRKLKEEGIPV